MYGTDVCILNKLRKWKQLASFTSHELKNRTMVGNVKCMILKLNYFLEG